MKRVLIIFTILFSLIISGTTVTSVSVNYVPEQPDPADTEYLVGTYYMPNSKLGTHFRGWPELLDYPLRKSLLGYYDQDDPEVIDWEIKWALEHG
ncbi:MAG: hypothetical protein KAS04_06190, partial [Candidatus Aenigmarchaeota archaeon]|nr:hypothetical protein [Candidatus Aenigmarchaeota archaeon]